MIDASIDVSKHGVGFSGTSHAICEGSAVVSFDDGVKEWGDAVFEDIRVA